MYLVMMTLQSGCFGVIFECSKPYKKSVFFSPSSLHTVCKSENSGMEEKQKKEQLISKEFSLLMFICTIWSETINELVF